jgi:malonyl-CoA/methylmalonyl-CoA synthetase
MAVQTADYIKMQWGIWCAGGIAVPISLSHPLPEIEYILQDTQAEILLTNQSHQEFLKGLKKNNNVQIILIEEFINSLIINQLPDIPISQKALIIYTSGTTAKPKGVVSTHQIISAQIQILIEAWAWQKEDFILEVLPLHHIHGLINVMSCALWSGAKILMLEKFEAEKVWQLFDNQYFTLFMAVPTVYHKLIQVWDSFLPEKKEALREKLQKFRLMVSGSAALPISTLEKWEQISGHILLERYGMTEIGMALSNPLNGKRKPGKVGLPLPSVEVRLVDEKYQVIENEGVAGEIQVKSPAVFLEYWQKPEATQAEFKDNWFRTGDMAQKDEDGYFQILGRISTDIIKTGGYKVSALEIEEVLRSHPDIVECAVVALADASWGEVIATAIILKNQSKSLTIKELREWAKTQLAHYKVPTFLKIVDELPRNAMGKVIKAEVKKVFSL